MHYHPEFDVSINGRPAGRLNFKLYDGERHITRSWKYLISELLPLASRYNTEDGRKLPSDRGSEPERQEPELCWHHLSPRHSQCMDRLFSTLCAPFILHS